MLKSLLIIITTSLLAAFTSAARSGTASDYSTLAAKAERFYNHKEWSSASAMYSLMLDERPDSASIYGYAMVAAGMRHADTEQIALLRQALNAHVPIDSLVSSTRRAAFEAGEAAQYEKFLLTVKKGEPWLKRSIDAYLLDYYLFRDDGSAIVQLSREMLAGLPDNEGFLYKLAQGQLLMSDIGGAMDTYRTILDLNPNAYDALLYLGCYHAMRYTAGSKTDAPVAREYLERALRIHSTPYVQSLIGTLP
ncbi:MAG: hypothetical protein NC043_08935 [Muribaculaceae bacterium]|nr:hypothetical protein [Muribaculaceae bacterium]